LIFLVKLFSEKSWPAGIAFAFLKLQIVNNGTDRDKRMKVAIALYGKRISPHFGSSSRMMLLDIRRGIILEKALIEIVGQNSWEMARRLVGLKVHSLICGGIQRYCKEWLLSKGVKVLDNKRGEAEEFIKKMFASKKKEGKEAATGSSN
jgi:predicted Fe-Mo cluster-binding NifX family protein